MAYLISEVPSATTLVVKSGSNYKEINKVDYPGYAAQSWTIEDWKGPGNASVAGRNQYQDHMKVIKTGSEGEVVIPKTSLSTYLGNGYQASGF